MIIGVSEEHHEAASMRLAHLVAIMARLRDRAHGCPWDLAQTFATIAPYTIEEAYEVADAIALSDMPGLCEELGDLLLQVVFHARMAEEVGAFDLADVIAGIVGKMERRHPHIFGDAGARSADEVVQAWEAIKAAEKPRASAMDGVARALPALMRADKLGRRAARTGFDWPDVAGVRAKVLEELDELADAPDAESRHEEVGDLLFSVANLARHLGVDPEDALRAANAKFERRFRAVENRVGPDLGRSTADDRERAWNEIKANERGIGPDALDE